MIDGKWDIRGVEELRKLFSKPRSGYWFKVNKAKAEEIVEILSKAYGIESAKVIVDIVLLRHEKCNAMYDSGRIYMYSRNHAKSIIHKFYHDLDWKTNRKYDSDDNFGGNSSYGWIFAEIVWNMVLVGIGMDGIFEPDYKEFVEHVEELINSGLSVDKEDLERLASKYKTPIY